LPPFPSTLTVTPFVSPTERSALLDVYAATGGVSWTGSVSGWSTGSVDGVDPCAPAWAGVTCAVSPTRVVYVSAHCV
jgi:hypothetical protein